jgi:hypothetical protein
MVEHENDLELLAGETPHGADDAATEHAPGVSSLALRDIPMPDYCDVVIVPTRGVEETDPRVWAEAIFAHENTPLSKRGLLAVRDEVVRLFDMVPPPLKDYVTDEVRGSEALIRDDDENLCGSGSRSCPEGTCCRSPRLSSSCPCADAWPTSHGASPMPPR